MNLVSAKEARESIWYLLRTCFGEYADGEPYTRSKELYHGGTGGARQEREREDAKTERLQRMWQPSAIVS